MNLKKDFIKTDKVHKTYKPSSGRGYEALRGIDISIDEGDFVIIFGPSGCGKTTLLHSLIGLENISKGKIYYRDRVFSDLTMEQRSKFRAKNIGMIYQQSFWVKSMNVLYNVCLPLFIKGDDIPEATKKAKEALRKVGMLEYAYKKPAQLSGGEQQRVGFARAIVNDPKIIFADEPTGNLDSENSDKIVDLLRSFNKDQGRTVVMVTHNLSYLKYANRKIAIRDGRVVEIDEEVRQELEGVK